MHTIKEAPIRITQLYTRETQAHQRQRTSILWATVVTFRNLHTLNDSIRSFGDSPRREGWRKPFHISGPSCNPQPSCSVAVLEGIWRRDPGKRPHTSSPGRSDPWMFVAPLSCGNQTQKAVAYTRTLHWSDGTPTWMVESQVYCPEMDSGGKESHLYLNVSLWNLN